MAKFGFFTVLIASIIIFNSCSKKNVLQDSFLYHQTKVQNVSGKPYGAYVAGRVAHLRKDFNSAADYYIQALQADPDNPELIGRVYLILASKGRIDEAAKYAGLSIENGDRNNFTYIIIAIDNMKKGNYEEARKIIGGINGVIYKDFISPLMSAWAYVGQGQKEKALLALAPLKKEPSFKALYNFQAGMINDYFDDTAAAQKNYEVIVNEEQLEMSFRALQVITNFYIRSNQKDKAVALAEKYQNEKALADMMRQLQKNVAEATPENTGKIIDDANKGNAEALFSIAATLRQGAAGMDLAHMFISLSIYENQDYDLAKLLLADILENREMYAEANAVYDEINKTSEAYYTAQMKKANNLMLTENYKAAELLLKSLALETNSYQLYLDLGDVLRVSNKQGEAIEYYEKAIDKLTKVENQHWILFYALGISYEQDGEWDKAEKNFKKALELSQNHYLVLNYLGYSWIKQGKNVDEAFSMIVDAYNQAPNDGNIADSLGWALYRLGLYDKAVVYMERASELEPANAVISDHLGDAYWYGGRKNEATFQWKHALIMKDPLGELNKKEVKEKIARNYVKNEPLVFDKILIYEKIADIAKE